MRAKQLVISNEVIMVLSDNLMTEIAEHEPDPVDAKICALLRRTGWLWVVDGQFCSRGKAGLDHCAACFQA